MGYKRRRGFRSRVLNIVRSDQETKRVVQTRQHYSSILNPEYPIRAEALYPPTSDMEPGTYYDGPDNYWCWNFIHNRVQVFPVDFLAIVKGFGSGYGAGLATVANTSSGAASAQVAISSGQPDQNHMNRIGSEIFLKGISFEFMLFLMPIIPYFKTNLYLIRHAKGDRPTQATLYKNYTGIKQLDMMDTRRYHIMKKWKIRKGGTDPTTAGTFMKQGMIAGNDMSEQQKDTLNVVQVPAEGAMTGPQWKEYIEEHYPEYQLASMDSFPQYYTPMNQKLLDIGFDGSKSTLVVKYSEPTVTGGNLYAVVRDNSTSSSQADFYTLLTNAHQGSSHPYVTQGFVDSSIVDHSEFALAEQVIIRKKIQGWIAPPNAAEDQVLIGMDRKVKIWIPGKMLYGGRVQYKEEFNAQGWDNSVERDHLYDYSLVFDGHYVNYQTWDWQTNLTSTDYPEMARISDFLAVTYFKDP